MFIFLDFSASDNTSEKILVNYSNRDFSLERDFLGEKQILSAPSKKNIIFGTYITITYFRTLLIFV